MQAAILQAKEDIRMEIEWNDCGHMWQFSSEHMLFSKLKAVIILLVAISLCHHFTVKCPKFGCPCDPHTVTTLSDVQPKVCYST